MKQLTSRLYDKLKTVYNDLTIFVEIGVKTIFFF